MSLYKIASFLCSLDNFLLTNVIFFLVLFCSWKSKFKMVPIWDIFYICSHQEKDTKIPLARIFFFFFLVSRIHFNIIIHKYIYLQKKKDIEEMAKGQKRPNYILTSIQSYTYSAHPIGNFWLPNFVKSADSSCMVALWCDFWCWFVISLFCSNQ